MNNVNIAVRFLVWTGVSQAWTFGATLYIIVVPFVEEVIILDLVISITSSSVLKRIKMGSKVKAHCNFNPNLDLWFTVNSVYNYGLQRFFVAKMKFSKGSEIYAGFCKNKTKFATIFAFFFA